MTLIQIVTAHQAIDALSDRDMNGQLAYRMAKFLSKTRTDYDFYSSEARKLYDKYGEKQSDDTLLIPAERVSEFNSALETLNGTNAEDPNIRFPLSEISSELKLSMRQIYPLLDFVDEDN